MRDRSQAVTRTIALSRVDDRFDREFWRGSHPTNGSRRPGASASTRGDSPVEESANEDLHDLLSALCAADARFLIVGACAGASHAEPRATGDLDVWVEASPGNAARVHAALREFGTPLHDLSEDDLARSNVVFQIGVPPRRIDILTSITGITFAEAWPARVTVAYGSVRCPAIGRDALIRNRLALGRPKVLLDVELLQRHR